MRIFGRAFFTEYFTDIGFEFDLALSAPQRQAASLKTKGVEGEQTKFRQGWRIMRVYVFSLFFTKKQNHDKIVNTRIFGRAFLLNILLISDSAPQRQAASLKNKGVEGEQTKF